ncbi:MAG: DUF1648 domain-containing protein [Gemmatimonadetes bacterium]|nr:DUF1648 domain-containing protein [Gemmatimonadota bacterium]MBM4191361.1 DUF1648 domain-containing protein [Gemmatimonadota bacterium]
MSVGGTSSGGLRLLRILPWAIVAVHLLFAIAIYPSLGPTVPTHLDFAGQVTRTRPTSWVEWFGLPMVSVATLVLLQGIGALLPKHPQLFNFPEKERFLRIPRAYHGPVLALMRATLDLTGVIVAVIFVLVHVMLWLAGDGEAPAAMHVVILLLSVGTLPMILVVTSKIDAAVVEAERRWKEDEARG